MVMALTTAGELLPIRMVWPSAGAWRVACTAITPLPPGRFSTVTVWPSSLDSCSP